MGLMGLFDGLIKRSAYASVIIEAEKKKAHEQANYVAAWCSLELDSKWAKYGKDLERREALLKQGADSLMKYAEQLEQREAALKEKAAQPPVQAPIITALVAPQAPIITPQAPIITFQSQASLNIQAKKLLALIEAEERPIYAEEVGKRLGISTHAAAVLVQKLGYVRGNRVKTPDGKRQPWQKPQEVAESRNKAAIAGTEPVQSGKEAVFTSESSE